MKLLVRGAMWIAVAVAVAACSEARPYTAPEPTTTTQAVTLAVPGGAAAPGGAPTPGASALQQLIDRVGQVDTADLQLGASFNRQFLSLQFRAVGLDATEAECAANEVAKQIGDDFATRSISAVMSGAGATPEIMLPCVEAQRLMQLASSGGRPDLSKVPIDVVRSTFGELASAGYESAGLDPVEATCLADRTVGALDDDHVRSLTGSLQADTAVLTAAVPECVTPDRINELAGG